VSKPEVRTIKILEEDLRVLLDVLRFAQQASDLFAREEIKKGTIVGAQKMRKVCDDSLEMFRILYPHLDFEDPTDDHHH
jgi:hypothetical protein